GTSSRTAPRPPASATASTPPHSASRRSSPGDRPRRAVEVDGLEAVERATPARPAVEERSRERSPVQPDRVSVHVEADHARIAGRTPRKGDGRAAPPGPERGRGHGGG